MSLLTIRDIPVTRFHCDFRLTNTVLSSDFALEHNLQHTGSISLTIKVNPSRAVMFTVDALISQYCPPGSQLILGCDVQIACTKASEPGLPDTLQRLSRELLHPQPVALPLSYSFGPSPTQLPAQSATATRENPGVAENQLSHRKNDGPRAPLYFDHSRTSQPSTSTVPNTTPSTPDGPNLLHDTLTGAFFHGSRCTPFSDDLSAMRQCANNHGINWRGTLQTADLRNAILHHIFTGACLMGNSEACQDSSS
ncbi:hypothetical protein K435DRAFT_800258 [Dendrothele bispora CBS 962.96]|uniref:Uncharacterized protein n=1 Tax=Dendrothele bispora (strain CBS 962.96) TaxID=1314807 RepID=A0A4S8LTQ7_DENBC|nr:hypothetical protein K435DRAFT_800258 [Dendrothele bispora CBS 962.96]